jgi:hypothetical protein
VGEPDRHNDLEQLPVAFRYEVAIAEGLGQLFGSRQSMIFSTALIALARVSR